jgi:prolyl 4-hydroxylase
MSPVAKSFNFCLCSSLKGSGSDVIIRDVFRKLADKGYVSDALFTYVITLYSSLPEKNVQAAYPRSICSLTWEFLSGWDDKRSLALKLKQNECEEAFAMTFMNSEAALDATQSKPSTLFFVKDAQGTRGRGMRVVTREDLKSCKVDASQIIQQAVQYLTLLNGCKFVVRFYLLVHDRSLFLHRRSVMIVHGSPYLADSTDYKVQIAHDFDQPESTAQLINSNAVREGRQWHESITQRVMEVLPALQPLIDATSHDCYAFIGGDALIEYTGEAKLIELNPFPCMCTKSEEFNTQVSQVVLNDLVLKVMFGESNEFDKVHSSKSAMV